MNLQEILARVKSGELDVTSARALIDALSPSEASSPQEAASFQTQSQTMAPEPPLPPMPPLPPLMPSMPRMPKMPRFLRFERDSGESGEEQGLKEGSLSFPLESTTRIELQIPVGDINLSAATGDKLEIDFESNVPWMIESRNVEGGSLSVRFEPTQARRHMRSVDLTAQVRVPPGVELQLGTLSGEVEAQGLRNSRLQLESLSGEIKIQGCEGEAALQSTSGNVEVEGHQGSAEVRTVSGDVEVRELRGAMLRFRSTSGNLTVEAANGDIVANTLSGDIEVTGGQGTLKLDSKSGEISVQGFSSTALDLHTLSGDVTLRCRDVPAWERGTVATTSGEIRVEIPPESSLRIEARTVSGDMSWPEEARVTREGKSRESCSLQGGAAATLALSSMSGDIAVELA